jgi:hypothetical protein
MSRNLVKEELVDYIVEPNFQVSSLQQGEHRVQLESFSAQSNGHL